ncbi:MAG: hypothetical protein ACKPGI_04385, partial [Verrucomicrobiota bacterium]
LPFRLGAAEPAWQTADGYRWRRVEPAGVGRSGFTLLTNTSLGITFTIGPGGSHDHEPQPGFWFRCCPGGCRRRRLVRRLSLRHRCLPTALSEPWGMALRGCDP